MKNTELSVSRLSHLECSSCGRKYPSGSIQNHAVCCTKPLLARYDLSHGPDRNDLVSRPSTMWRYAESLPVIDPEHIVSLGEGWTPIVELIKMGSHLGLDSLLLKDEGMNPTGSFKARGISAAVSKSKELGIKSGVIPTAGNAGGALAAYCAKADIRATVIMPKHTPKLFQSEVEFYGARLILLDGLIDRCGAEAQKLKVEEGLFDFSTLKEPYRLEGKKTMGYEIAEQLNWQLPDVIIYPTGGGTGLIGIWKAFGEMLQMGWIKGPLPRMIAVQSENCCPVVHAFQNKNANSSEYRESVAGGLAVPKVFGMDLMLQTLHESGGMALAVEENMILHAVRELSEKEGIMVCPEGAVTLLGLRKVLQSGHVSPDEQVLLLNTGSAYKYFENYT